MEVEQAVVKSVVSRCLLKDLEALIKEWGCFSEKDIKQINFTERKQVIATQIFNVCKERGLRYEIGDLDLLCTQLHSAAKKWSVHKLKGGIMKTDLNPKELQGRLAVCLECAGVVDLNMRSYGGATWLRIYLRESERFQPSAVSYILFYPHTPFLIACRMLKKTQELLFCALMDVFECEEIAELQLTGHHLPSLADLALQQSSQGPFRKYRDLQENDNPLVRSKFKKRKKEEEEMDWDPRLKAEDGQVKRMRQDNLDSTFGTHTQPTLEKLEYKCDLRFRGTTFAPGMLGRTDLFHCKIKLQGDSVLEGIKSLAKCGLATLPLPRHISSVPTLAKNHFTLAELEAPKRK